MPRLIIFESSVCLGMPSLAAAPAVVAKSDALGVLTKYNYNALNQVTKITDPLRGTTMFGYDPNGNLLSVTDANGHATTYTYDTSDRLSTRVDPLNRSEGYQYDGNSNLTQFTDRRGKITTYNYDSLNRKTFAGFGQSGTGYESTIGYTLDGGNRLTQVVDSGAGRINRGYDLLDRMTSESTPQGSVGYGYDAAGRRTSIDRPLNPHEIEYDFGVGERGKYVKEPAQRGGDHCGAEAGRRRAQGGGCGAGSGHVHAHDLRVEGEVRRDGCKPGAGRRMTRNRHHNRIASERRIMNIGRRNHGRRNEERMSSGQRRVGTMDRARFFASLRAGARADDAGSERDPGRQGGVDVPAGGRLGIWHGTSRRRSGMYLQSALSGGRLV